MLLMSDGVYNALSDQELIAALEGRDAQAAADAVGEAIRRKAYPTQDNYTLVVLEMGRDTKKEA